MASETSRLRRTALILGVLAVGLGAASFAGLFWVISQTDTGLSCSAPYTEADRPGACSVYDVPFWMLGLAAACAVGALVALCAAPPRTSPER